MLVNTIKDDHISHEAFLVEMAVEFQLMLICVTPYTSSLDGT